MRTMHKALLLGAAHLAIVLSLGGKYLLDRATRPRVWMRAAPVDPNLPIRGRYVVLSVSVPVAGKEVALERKSREQWLEYLKTREDSRAAKPAGTGPSFTPNWDPARPIPQVRIEVRGSEAWGQLVQAPEGTTGVYRRGFGWNGRMAIRRTVGVDLEESGVGTRGAEPPPGLAPADLDRWLDGLPAEQIPLAEPLAYFIPEKVADPSRRAADEELWVEVTIPRRGPLRPIRLAVKKAGTFTPLVF